MPMHPRRFARVKPAGLVSRQAKIITDPRAPVIPCTLIDYSPGGACVDLGGQVSIPDRFELLHVNTKKRCRIAWKRGTRVGVVF
ncbi:PilZ domain-containing protein [Bradyrhizobium niftali]|uniref:PilZ domain-containing protein n=2 Tax=Nitrobacteraceae TaxID=41294 RepID=A0A4Y9LXJ1_9BRAD|nr:PilZ domain-containing protein [Bradyrhizobium niftali]